MEKSNFQQQIGNWLLNVSLQLQKEQRPVVTPRHDVPGREQHKPMHHPETGPGPGSGPGLGSRSGSGSEQGPVTTVAPVMKLAMLAEASIQLFNSSV